MTNIKTGIDELDAILQDGIENGEIAIFLGIPVRIPRGIPHPDPENDPDKTFSWSPLNDGQEETDAVETQGE